MPASPAKVSLRAPLASASSWISEKTRPAAAPARFAPRGAAAAVASAAAFFAQAASSAPVTSSVASTVRPPASSRSCSWRRRSASCVATTTDAPSSIASRACAGPARRRHRARADALGDERGGSGAERRHESLRRDEHGGAVAHARADLADRGRQARARHGEHDEVDAGELDLGHGLDVDRLVELEAGQVARVLAAGAERLRLRGGPAAELDLDARAREHRRGGRAHRARADDGGGAQRRQAAEPLPLELDARPDALGDLAGEERRRLVHAREGERGPAADVDLGRLDPPAAAGALRVRSRRSARPACRSGGPGARRRASAAPATPSGSGCPRGRSRPPGRARAARSAVSIDSSSEAPRLIGNAPRQLRNQPSSGFLNSSRFATK